MLLTAAMGVTAAMSLAYRVTCSTSGLSDRDIKFNLNDNEDSSVVFLFCVGKNGVINNALSCNYLLDVRACMYVALLFILYSIITLGLWGHCVCHPMLCIYMYNVVMTALKISEEHTILG